MNYPNPSNQPWGEQPQPGAGQPYGSPQPQYGQPQYGQPQYGAHAPGTPGYGYPVGGPSNVWQVRANPVAGILLLLGAIAGLLVGLLPWAINGDNIGVITGIDFLDVGGTEQQVFGIAILATAAAALLLLIPAGMMFAARPHKGASVFAVILALVMVIAGVLAIVVTDGAVFDFEEIPAWLLVFAGLPALIGALVGSARK